MLSFLPHFSVLVPRSRAIPGGLEPAMPSEGELERCSGRRGAPHCSCSHPCPGQGGCCLHRGSACNWHQHRHRGLTAEPGSTAVTPCCRVVQDGQRRCLLWLDVSYSCPSPGGLSSTPGQRGKEARALGWLRSSGSGAGPVQALGRGVLSHKERRCCSGAAVVESALVLGLPGEGRDPAGPLQCTQTPTRAHLN